MAEPDALYRTVNPTNAPLTAANALAHDRLSDDADEVALVDGFVASATAKAAAYLRRQLITQTWRLELAQLPDVLQVPLAPVQSVADFTYLDTNGARQTLAADQYRLTQNSGAWYLRPAYETSWPDHRCDFGSIEIDLIVGYGDNASDVPADIVQAIRFMVANFMDHRASLVDGAASAEIPMGARDMLRPHVFWV